MVWLLSYFENLIVLLICEVVSMKKKSKVLIVIPAYNEAENIEKVVKDIKNNCDYDYLVINDGSRDNTLEILKKNNYSYLNLPVNYGLASAVQTGFKYAYQNHYDVVIQFDGDGQHQAKYLKSLVDEIEKGSDIVIGSRFVTAKKDFHLRMIGSRLLTFVIYLTTLQKITDPTSGLRAYGSRVIPEFALEMNYPPEPDSIAYLIKRKFKVCEVQVKMLERIAGQSYLTSLKSMQYMLKMVISILLIQLFRKR